MPSLARAVAANEAIRTAEISDKPPLSLYIPILTIPGIAVTRSDPITAGV
jgi:hypothetical protein